MDDYLKKYRNRDVRIVGSSIEKFKECTNNPRLTISQITPSVMEAFKDYLIHDAGLSGETPHNYFTRFKKADASSYSSITLGTRSSKNSKS